MEGKNRLLQVITGLTGYNGDSQVSKIGAILCAIHWVVNKSI